MFGIRVEPKAMTIAIVEGSRDRPVLVGMEKASAPATYDDPAALKWYRSRLLTLINQYQPQAIAIRLAESFGRQGNSDSDRRRSRIEGVLMELGATQGLTVEFGNLKSLGARLSFTKPKEELEHEDLRGLDWSKLSKNEREAIFAATSGLEDSQ